MKSLAWIVGVAVVLTVAVFAAQLIASETGEVVVLHTRGADASATTRLWVVDHDGQQWLRAGGPESGWYDRLRAEPRVRVDRDGVRGDYVAHLEPDMSPTINGLMAAKYGWRDTFIGLLVGGRDDAVAVRLVQAE